MRPCPRCSVAMRPHARQFAEIDVCPQCSGAFFDLGEGVAAVGAEVEPRFLIDDGRAAKVGPSSLRCPAHATESGGDYRSAPMTKPASDAPIMILYRVGEGELAVEVDYCPTCGGFYLDADEDVGLLDVARGVEQAIQTTSGARFAAPPGDAHAKVVDAARTRGAFEEMMRGVVDGLVEHQRRRRIIARTGGATGPFSPYDD